VNSPAHEPVLFHGANLHEGLEASAYDAVEQRLARYEIP